MGKTAAKKMQIKPGRWVAYHKSTSPVKTDINRDSIWRYVKTLQMDAVSQISIHEDWSALRLKPLG